MSMQEITQYLQILRRRWWMFAAAIGVVAAVALIGASAVPRQYEASVRFVVNVPPSGSVALFPTFDSPSQLDQVSITRTAFKEVLVKPSVIRRAIESEGLNLDWREVQNTISIEQASDSEFVTVAVRAATPQQAADLANALVTAGREYFGEFQAAPAASAREFITTQVADAREQLDSSKQALREFQQKNSISDLAGEISSEREIITRLKLSSSEATVNGNTAMAAAYERLIKVHQKLLFDLYALTDQSDSLVESVRDADEYYRFFVNKETEARLKEIQIRQAEYIQLVEAASAPEGAVSPIDLRIVAFGLVAALVIAAILVFGVEYAETHRPDSRVGNTPQRLPNAANGD